MWCGRSLASPSYAQALLDHLRSIRLGPCCCGHISQHSLIFLACRLRRCCPTSFPRRHRLYHDLGQDQATPRQRKTEALVRDGRQMHADWKNVRSRCPGCRLAVNTRSAGLVPVCPKTPPLLRLSIASSKRASRFVCRYRPKLILVVRPALLSPLARSVLLMPRSFSPCRVQPQE